MWPRKGNPKEGHPTVPSLRDTFVRAGQTGAAQLALTACTNRKLLRSSNSARLNLPPARLSRSGAEGEISKNAKSRALRVFVFVLACPGFSRTGCSVLNFVFEVPLFRRRPAGRATQGTPQGRRNGVPFSLAPFFWASKRKIPAAGLPPAPDIARRALKVLT